MLICVLAGLIPTMVVALAANVVSSKIYVRLADESLNSYHNALDVVLLLYAYNITDESRVILSNLESLESLDAKTDPEMGTSLAKLVQNNRNMDYLAVFGQDGQIVWSSSSGNVPKELDLAVLRDAPATTDRATMSESLPGALDMRFVSPITLKGQPAGKLVTGKFIFDDGFMDELKEALGVEFTVFSHDTRYNTTLKNRGQKAIGTKIDNPEVLDKVLGSGQSLISKSTIFGQNYDTIYWPVLDGDRKPIGMYFLGIPATDMEQNQREFFISVATIMIIMTLLVILASKLVINSINRALNNIMGDLNNSFDEVNRCSDDILRSSETLSQGATQQSSSLQDTAAALEEMMAMVKKSAENSKLTKGSNTETNKLIKEGVKLTGEMTDAMGLIETSARKIEAIIKTIDDIAFQTNLLALNAAVEAARAGEAGAGFAVVADEVRNLSLRSSEAAKNTNDLITTSVDRVNYGARIAHQLDECFKRIEQGADMVSELIDQISVATSEQTRGAAMAEQAVETTNKVAERNAQEAGNTAMASKSLTHAAQDLDESISHLDVIITGKRNHSANFPGTSGHLEIKG
jgi:methyl-accepting chemotaxis protein